MTKTVSLDRQRQCDFIAESWEHNLNSLDALTKELGRIGPQISAKRRQISELKKELDSLSSPPLAAGRRIGMGLLGIAAEAAIENRRRELQGEINNERQILAEMERERMRIQQKRAQYSRLLDESVRKWHANRCDEVRPRPPILPAS